MSRLLLPMLEWLGQLRLFGSFVAKPTFKVGDPNALDSQGSLEWRDYLDPERLYLTWGPHPASPWAPFHCVTLFASIETRDRMFGVGSTIGPQAVQDLPAWVDVDEPAPSWLTPEVWTIVDLPGGWSAALGVMLASVAQPVCTFDNWPAGSGAIRAETTLAALLHYAARMRSRQLVIGHDAPPMWLCDRSRFAVSKPGPGNYDNRYFLDDRLIPGASTLNQAGIRRIVYVTPGRTDAVTADLGRHLVEFEKQGIAMLRVSLDDRESLNYPVPLSLVTLTSFDSSVLDFMRSIAGGFGGFVPHPSSGG